MLIPLILALQLRIVQPHPDCNIFEKKFDNPFSDHSGWVMRRYQWHTMYPILTSGLAYGINRVIHKPKVSAFIATLATGLAPHIRGSIKELYTINPLDWAYDLENRSLPAWYATAGDNIPSRGKAIAEYLALDFSLVCWSSP
jgi:hypothetical protein